MSTDIQKEYRDRLARHGFDLEERIGRGAFGSVYRGTQRSLGRLVAVKFFDSTLNNSPSERKRFEREARLLARVDHPSIPYVLTQGLIEKLDPTVPYFVMQFISGMSLATRLKASRMPLSDACRIADEILDALGTAHKHEIIHRDVKPDNIILSTSRSYLLDFSLGFCREYEPGLSIATLPGRGLGVPEYASPEQKEDSHSVDGRTDVYSVGVMLLEMLGGSAKRGIEDLDADLSAAPAEARRIIRRACALDVTARFQSSEEFRKALRPLLRPEVLELAPSLALCPNPKCAEATLSEGGYFWGPRVVEKNTTSFCDSCGTPWLRRCPGCGLPLASGIGERVTKVSKSGPDNGIAYCGACGEKLFETPKCERCSSLLKQLDMDRDTAESGCSKCTPPEPVPLSDDDIPF